MGHDDGGCSYQSCLVLAFPSSPKSLTLACAALAFSARLCQLCTLPYWVAVVKLVISIRAVFVTMLQLLIVCCAWKINTGLACL